MDQWQELLNDGQGQSLGDVIGLSLRIPAGEKSPARAQFVMDWKRDIKNTNAFTTDDISESTVKATAAEFMENFIHLMVNKGYALKPFDSQKLDYLYAEEFELNGKSREQMTRDFETGIQMVKDAIARARFGRASGGAGIA